MNGLFRHHVMRNNVFKNEIGITFQCSQMKIIEPFLKNVEGYESFMREDTKWYNHLTHDYRFVRWDDIRRIDKEAFDAMVVDWVQKYDALANEYDEIIFKYGEYVNKESELCIDYFKKVE